VPATVDHNAHGATDQAELCVNTDYREAARHTFDKKTWPVSTASTRRRQKEATARGVTRRFIL
jgi:hypothetical protein